MEYEFIHFVEIEQKPKTKVYSCRNNKSDVELGTVGYYPMWRQYCFYPGYIQAVYSAGCLKDISDFLEKLNTERRNG